MPGVIVGVLVGVGGFLVGVGVGVGVGGSPVGVGVGVSVGPEMITTPSARVPNTDSP